MSKLPLIAVALLFSLSFKRPEPVDTWYPPAPPDFEEPQLPAVVVRPVVVIPPRPECPVHQVRVRVTACSPQDPQDVEYYARNGYAGAIHNVAADYRVFPKGTLIRVPGYMDVSHPAKLWEVDSAGGSVIRRATKAGIKQIDVKFRTLHSARAWGSRSLVVEVVYPDELADWQRAVAAWDAAYAP